VSVSTAHSAPHHHSCSADALIRGRFLAVTSASIPGSLVMTRGPFLLKAFCVLAESHTGSRSRRRMTASILASARACVGFLLSITRSPCSSYLEKEGRLPKGTLFHGTERRRFGSQSQRQLSSGAQKDTLRWKTGQIALLGAKSAHVRPARPAV
jgi:hypothetical protein